MVEQNKEQKGWKPNSKKWALYIVATENCPHEYLNICSNSKNIEMESKAQHEEVDQNLLAYLLTP